MPTFLPIDDPDPWFWGGITESDLQLMTSSVLTDDPHLTLPEIEARILAAQLLGMAERHLVLACVYDFAGDDRGSGAMSAMGMAKLHQAAAVCTPEDPRISRMKTAFFAPGSRATLEALGRTESEAREIARRVVHASEDMQRDRPPSAYIGLLSTGIGLSLVGYGLLSGAICFLQTIVWTTDLLVVLADPPPGPAASKEEYLVGLVLIAAIGYSERVIPLIGSLAVLVGGASALSGRWRWLQVVSGVICIVPCLTFCLLWPLGFLLGVCAIIEAMIRKRRVASTLTPTW